MIYQKNFMKSEMVEKTQITQNFKDLFKDNIELAFDEELKKYLEKMDPLEIPDTLTSFYYTNIQIKNDEDEKNEV